MAVRTATKLSDLTITPPPVKSVAARVIPNFTYMYFGSIRTAVKLTTPSAASGELCWVLADGVWKQASISL